MSIFESSVAGTITRGGQTTIHFIRMIIEIAKKFFKLCLLIYLISTCLIFYFKTTQGERYLTLKWMQAVLAVKILGHPNQSTTLTLGSEQQKVYWLTILNNKNLIDNINQVYRTLLHALLLALLSLIIFATIIIRFVYRAGRAQLSDDFVRGNQVVNQKTLIKIIHNVAKKKHSGKKANISIAGIPIPYRSDLAHILIAGGPGTGKSVSYKSILNDIRQHQKRAIVYDTAGEYIKHFYRADKDIILNPLDARSHSWDIWCDCKEEYDFMSLAEALIPRGKHHDFFDVAARLVFSSIAYEMGKEGQPTTEKLMHTLLKLDMDAISKLVQGTDAASILNEEAGRMAASVRGVISAHTQALKFLRQDGNRFSIKDWVKNREDDSWIFISSNDEQMSLMRPLISVWLNLAGSAMLSLEPDLERRIYLVIDELPSLNRLPALTNFLAQGRKYGGCGIIGFQNYPQLVALYGREGSDAIVDLCSTWAIFRCNSKSGAKWASDNLGNIESIETTEGISYGINEIRDGVNVNKSKRERSIITYTELMNLPDLFGYIRLGRGFPIARFRMDYVAWPVVAPCFVNRGSHHEYVVGNFNGMAQGPFDSSVALGDGENIESKSSSDHKQIKVKQKPVREDPYGDIEL